MRKALQVIALVIVLGCWLGKSAASGQQLKDILESLSKEYSFTFSQMKVDTFFSEKYELNFLQPLDHDNPDGKTFHQKVYLSHKGYDQPVVLITEGYSAFYGSMPWHVNEVAGLIGANQVCVEHRFFGESVPDSVDWQYLTVKNAANDHHRIVEALKHIYSGKWVNTGISKGGQTMMYHRYFFPDDVDASVGYVCPLNFSIEDKRVYRFLDNVGDEACRREIGDFQTELFMNKQKYLPVFEKMANDKGLTYGMGFEKAYELTVLEYSFAFWQWGAISCDSIPGMEAGAEAFIQHLGEVAGFDWVSDQGIDDFRPFFYQALTEIGFYGYDIAPFRKWSSFSENPVFTFTAPAGTNPEFDPSLMYEVDCFIRHEAENMIFIYGEWDPWSATAVDLTCNTNSAVFVSPGGNHTTRISTLPEDMRLQLLDLLNSWLE